MQLLLVLVLALALGAAVAEEGSGGCTPEDDSFDYFLLAAQWPPAFGRLVSHFTIHGLWPSRSAADATTYPCNCANPEQFDLGKLQPIHLKLESDWPSLKSTDDASFWEHEWFKHGTCTAFGLLGYFNTTLALRDAHNPGRALAKLHPSNTRSYGAAEVSAAMKAALGRNVLLGCINLGENQVLSEVGLCLTKPGLRLIEPPPNVKLVRDEVNDCDPSREIFILKNDEHFRVEK